MLKAAPSSVQKYFSLPINFPAAINGVQVWKKSASAFALWSQPCPCEVISGKSSLELAWDRNAIQKWIHV